MPCGQMTTMNICGAAPQIVHLTTCGPPGKKFGHPWAKAKYFWGFLFEKSLEEHFDKAYQARS